MLKALGRRLLQTIPTLIGVSLLVFVLVRLTGDPATVMLPPETPPEAVQQFREANGLDRPLPLQYVTFVANAAQGDLGNSIRYREPVVNLLGQAVPATLSLTLTALAIAVLVGFPLGMLAGQRAGSRFDRIARTFALLGQATPSFYLGLLLILVFGVNLRVLPTGGRDGISSLVLPAVTLAMFLMPLVLRVSRGALLDVVRQDYVRTARARGMTERRILIVHMLRNSLIPVVTIVGLQLGAALSGAIVVETVFAWPGMGQLLVNSVYTRDFPVVQGVVLFSCVAFILANLIVDVLYARIDPRIAVK